MHVSGRPLAIRSGKEQTWKWISKVTTKIYQVRTYLYSLALRNRKDKTTETNVVPYVVEQNGTISKLSTENNLYSTYFIANQCCACVAIANENF